MRGGNERTGSSRCLPGTGPGGGLSSTFVNIETEGSHGFDQTQF